MTKVDDILNELWKGTSLTDIRKDKDFKSQTQITTATQLYLAKAEKEIAKKQGTLETLNTQTKNLQVKVNAAKEECSLLNKTILEAETDRKKLQQELTKLKVKRKPGKTG